MRKIFLFIIMLMLASIMAATAGSIYYFDLLEDVYKENRMADNSFGIVGENNTLYRFVLSDTTYTVNGTSVLWSGRGGASRWIAIAGQYAANALTMDAGLVLSDTLGVSGTARLDSTVTITDDLVVTGAATVTGLVTGLNIGMGAYADSSVTDSCAVDSTWYAHGGTFTLQHAALFSAATTYTPGFKYTGTDSLQFVIEWHMCVSGDSDSMVVRGGVLVDSVYVTGSQMGAFLRETDHAQTLSGVTVVGLATGNEVQIAVWSDTAADKITVDYMTIAIRRLY